MWLQAPLMCLSDMAAYPGTGSDVNRLTEGGVCDRARQVMRKELLFPTFSLDWSQCCSVCFTVSESNDV
jgi:hypothetical protein